MTRDELSSACFPHPVREVAVRETHISLVVLTGDFAYKIKKAIHLDFIDASSLERRRELCEEELRLNRRFAADLYLSVVPVTRDGERLRFGGEGSPVEYAVCMRQFDASEELQALLAANAVAAAEIAQLAERLADFHGEAAAAPAAAGFPRTEAFLRIARANMAGVTGRADSVDAGAAAAELNRWTEKELARRLNRLREREQQGFIRECHGDLHARNIVRWRGELTPFDCIEFDADLRFIDVLSDLAFLVMDLIARERSDLAFTLLNRYLERTGDYSGAELLPCYLVHRALVRAKVDLIAIEQHSGASDARDRALARIHTAMRFIQTRKPLLIVMHGASGSGKSWLSERIAPQISAVRIRSDLERKRLAGVDPLAQRLSAGEDIYTRAFNDRTYAHLRTCALSCLRGGLNTIVDAAFLDVNERRMFAQLAAEAAAGFLILACHADRDTLAGRIEQRRAARNDPSDADLQVLERQLTTMQPFGQEEEPHLVRIDTRDPEAVRQALDQVLLFASP